MGRSALDEDAIRTIEQNNPDVEFDWTRILKGQGAPEAPAATRPEEDRRPSRRPERRQARPSAPVAAPPASEPDVETSHGRPDAEIALEQGAEVESSAIDAPPLPSARPAMPEEPMTAAQARLGTEGLVRLRARYSEMLARISERVPDEARQEELKGEAERLNPDTWVTNEDVSVGLERYEAVLEALRSVVGQGHRRRRRGERDTGGQAAVPRAIPDTSPRDEEAAPVDTPGPAPDDDPEPL